MNFYADHRQRSNVAGISGVCAIGLEPMRQQRRPENGHFSLHAQCAPFDQHKKNIIILLFIKFPSLV